eukprot:Ihof_evm2s898 gene=Ihof_evmTU2s898
MVRREIEEQGFPVPIRFIPDSEVQTMIINTVSDTGKSTGVALQKTKETDRQTERERERERECVCVCVDES